MSKMVIQKNKKIKKVQENESTPEKKQMSKDDIEFLEKIMKIKDDASKKVSQEINSFSDSEDIKKCRTDGKNFAKQLEEIEECKKIVKEFEANPVIINTVHVNGVLFERIYENPNAVKKLELLKKHNFHCLKATKDISTDTITYRTLGRVYVKRGAQKIILPKTSQPQVIASKSITGMGYGEAAISFKDYSPFILQDGDIIATDADSYLLDINGNSTENKKINVLMFPNSEIKIKVKKKQEDRKPSFIDPSIVPEIVKQRSTRTIITYSIESIELIKGIFHVNAEDYSGGNPQNLFKISSNYPQIEFRSSSQIGVTILSDILKKMKTENYKDKMGLLESKYKKSIANAKNKKCDSIYAYIELCNDGSIVIFETLNSVGYKGTNKFTHPLSAEGNKYYLKKGDISIPGKITITSKNIYATAESDPRVEAMVRHWYSLNTYIGMSEIKEDYENRLKETEKKPVKHHIETPAEKAYKEQEKKKLLEQLDYYKKYGDQLEIEAIELQIKELEGKDSGQGNTGLDINYAKKMIEHAEKEMERVKPYIKADFPGYAPVGKNTKIY